MCSGTSKIPYFAQRRKKEQLFKAVKRLRAPMSYGILERRKVTKRLLNTLRFNVDPTFPIFKKRPSRFKQALLAKQRFRWFYSPKNEKVLKFYVRSASFKSFSPVQGLLGLMESQVSMVLLRSGFFRSLRHIRQSIKHGLVYVNGQTISSTAHRLLPGDEISLSPRLSYFLLAGLGKYDHQRRRPLRRWLPPYLEFSPSLFRWIFSSEPTFNQVSYPFGDISPTPLSRASRRNSFFRRKLKSARFVNMHWHTNNTTYKDKEKIHKQKPSKQERYKTTKRQNRAIHINQQQAFDKKFNYHNKGKHFTEQNNNTANRKKNFSSVHNRLFHTVTDQFFNKKSKKYLAKVKREQRQRLFSKFSKASYSNSGVTRLYKYKGKFGSKPNKNSAKKRLSWIFKIWDYYSMISRP